MVAMHSSGNTTQNSQPAIRRAPGNDIASRSPDASACQLEPTGCRAGSAAGGWFSGSAAEWCASRPAARSPSGPAVRSPSEPAARSPSGPAASSPSLSRSAADPAEPGSAELGNAELGDAELGNAEP